MHEVSYYSSVSLENGGELCENVTYLGKNSCEALATHKGIVLENVKLFIYSNYKVALVTAYWEGQFKQWLKQTSFPVVGSGVVFYCYYIVEYSLKQ